MYNFFGRITVATSCGDDFFDTINVSSFAEACVEIGVASQMFLSFAILKCEVINRIDDTSTVIMEIDEHSKECSYRFAKSDENYHEMCSTLRERWNSLHSAQSAYDDYLYSGSKFPKLN